MQNLVESEEDSVSDQSETQAKDAAKLKAVLSAQPALSTDDESSDHKHRILRVTLLENKRYPTKEEQRRE